MISIFGMGILSNSGSPRMPMLPQAQLTPPQMWPESFGGGDGFDFSPEMMEDGGECPHRCGSFGQQDGGLDAFGGELEGLEGEERSEALHAIADLLKKLHDLRKKKDQG